MENSLNQFQQQIALFEQQDISAYVQGKNTYAALQHGASLNPNKVAIRFMLKGQYYDKHKIPFKAKLLGWLVKVFKGHDFAVPYKEVSYQELMSNINRVANSLYQFGVQSDDVVSLLLPNFIETHYALWGSEAAGVVNPVNPMLEPETIAEILKAAKAKVLITLGPVPGTDIWQKALKVKQLVPSLTHMLVLYGEHQPEKGIYGFWQTLSEQPGDKLLFQRQIQPDDPASMFHTGGTTGTPKLAVHSHFNEVANAAMLAMGNNPQASDSGLVGLPLFHVNAAIGTGLMPLSLGQSIVLAGPAGFRTEKVFENFFAMLEHHKVSFFSAVPTVYAALLKQPSKGRDFSSVKFAVSGAAPMPVSVFSEFQDKTGIKLLEAYGLTEGTCVSSLTPIDVPPKIGSIGMPLPFSGMCVVIFDEQDKFVRMAEKDEVGTLLISGPNVFKGYLQEEHNKGLWLDIDGTQWFNTGDMARVDNDGFYWLTGRKKELIIRGGHNIDPKMIEETIAPMDGVDCVAAVGRPDPYAGELPVVYVTLTDQSLTEKDILEYAVARIAERAAIPKKINIIPEMPVTAIGKIFKPQLVWREAQGVALGELETLLKAEMSNKRFRVRAEKNEKHGYVVRVELPKQTNSELLKKVKERLNQYHFQHQVDCVIDC